MKVVDLILINLLILIPLFVVIAFFTLVERKIMASMQRRLGPTVTGYFGFIQPIADGIKLILKEIIVPSKANFFIFLFAPIFMMSLSFTLWTLLPFSFNSLLVNSNFSLLLLFTLSSLNVYSVILSGWASNSKYAFMGSIRSISQLLSYELILGTVILIFITILGSFNLLDIIYYQINNNFLFFWPLLPVAIISFIIFLAETNRVPFDLPEAESELVAGYNVEYSSITFAMFFLGEYCNILVMSTLWVVLFLGGWGTNSYNLIDFFIFTFKILWVCFLFIFIRALLPRYRFDQLILVGWQILLPFTFSFFFFILCFLLFTDGLPLYMSLFFYGYWPNFF